MAPAPESLAGNAAGRRGLVTAAGGNPSRGQKFVSSCFFILLVCHAEVNWRKRSPFVAGRRLKLRLSAQPH